jgi:hypothetical protein
MANDSFRDRLINELPPVLRAGVQARVVSGEKTPKIRKFHLNRVKDESGVSGTGIVAVGVVLPSGRAIMEWTSTRTGIPGFELHDNVENVEAIHGHAGATEIVFDDEE